MTDRQTDRQMYIVYTVYFSKMYLPAATNLNSWLKKEKKKIEKESKKEFNHNTCVVIYSNLWPFFHFYLQTMKFKRWELI